MRTPSKLLQWGFEPVTLPPRQDSEQAVNPTSFQAKLVFLSTDNDMTSSSSPYASLPRRDTSADASSAGIDMSSCVMSFVDATPPFSDDFDVAFLNGGSHSPAKQISVVKGLGPGHDLSGKVATVFENSRNILHLNELFKMVDKQNTKG